MDSSGILIIGKTSGMASCEKIRKREHVQINTTHDRCIVNTVIIELVDNNWHYSLIFCYGSACAGSPYDENEKFESRNLALAAGFKAMINNHTKWLSEAGDPLFNYKRKYMESVIYKAKLMLGNLEYK